jgi:hypothetical protein
MSQHEKQLLRMRQNPLNGRIEDIKTIADHYGIRYRQPGTSHVIFSIGMHRLAVPAHKPVKPIYVQKFLTIIDCLREEEIQNA